MRAQIALVQTALQEEIKMTKRLSTYTYCRENHTLYIYKQNHDRRSANNLQLLQNGWHALLRLGEPYLPQYREPPVLYIIYL